MLKSISMAGSEKAPMTVRVLVLTGLLLSLPAQRCYAAADTQGHIPTVTRLVLQFSDLENTLASALAQHNSAMIQSLVADDFELRAGAKPGEPIARADWLRHAPSPSGKPSRIEQMAVHDHGNVAIVSFLWRINAGLKSEQAVFTVDVWRHTQNSWQLATRYAAPAGNRSSAIPGAAPDEPPIEKKY